ncbi:structural maintenance of chromosomes protein 6 isoform X2 [Belonocnema kinseyi]|uniref:structural maintenance of chromosomes protein 6 isoform X2 n=1 Tax=Belonocnema kinseyi TaxID=2817044 RepID=UPI00143DF80C|nr:structural maintenance of chromosomes protein 6 isoform X2 [Belonocnema kinseyi]
MANERERKKRKTEQPEDPHQAKRQREQDVDPTFQREQTVGKVKRVFMRNFMCHDALEVNLNPNVNFIVGRNGSGKSAILTALTVGLGSKAKVTDRGKSLKDFIKQGRNTASVDITLTNAGTGSYKHDIYGDAITVCRTVGASSSYKIKNWRVLNQDVSRSFLVTASPADKYNLFMKATRLDLIGANYKEAHSCNEDSRRRLRATEECLAETEAEMKHLEQNLQMLEKVDEAREQYSNLQIELQWSVAIGEEKSLNSVKQQMAECEKEVEKILAVDEEREEKLIKINNKIEELNGKIQEAKDEATITAEAYKIAKTAVLHGKEAQSAKIKEWRSAQAIVNRTESDIGLLRTEIEKLEAGSSKYEAEKQEAREKLAKLEQNLDEVQATLRTKQTDQMHTENDRARLQQQEQALRIQVESSATRIRQITQNLSAIKRQSNNAMTVYSPNMPRLLKRIDEEFRKGRFREKPLGPIGSFIKLNDSDWIPAVENFLSPALLNGFCVDNTQDAKKLGMIMREVFRDERCPQITSSKFHDRVHNVEQHCARSSDYLNLLDAMEISHPVIANCLIDQREIECVMLIPTSEEACAVMSNAQYVPKNCKKAFTQQGDLFFPDPNYKTYGGRRGMRAKFLQVSTTQAIQLLEEDKETAEKEQERIVTEFNEITKKIRKSNIDLQQLNETVAKLRTMEGRLKSTMAALRDKLEVENTNSIEVYTEEMDRHQTKLQKVKAEEDRLKKEIAEMQTNVAQLDKEAKRCRDLINELDFRLNPIKDKITQLNDQRTSLRSNCQNGTKKLQIAKQNVLKCTADLEKQQRVVDAAVRKALEHGERVDTPRTAREITRTADEIKAQIEMIENEYGSKDDLNQELVEKRNKYGQVIYFATELRKSCEKHQTRLVKRRQLYREMKRQIGQKVQEAFKNVLSLRKYKGSIKIDHKEKTLELEVNPQNDAKRPTNDAKSLSGGERSYSTVAFILALWDCTGLPFYFLDEFDVFMDKINRRVIMDILLDHTRSHPQSQFAFLTPLDTSSIQVDDYITIHRLAAPERSQNAE